MLLNTAPTKRLSGPLEPELGEELPPGRWGGGLLAEAGAVTNNGGRHSAAVGG